MGLSHSAELDVAESPAEEALPAVSHVDALPDELAVRVCSTLGASDLVSLMRTSRRFRDMIRADVALWDGLAADRFGPATADPADGDGEQPATQLIDMDLLTSIIERIAMPDEPEPEAPLRSERARAISLVPSGVPHPTRSTERLSLTGGLPNYVRLVAVQRALARQLRVLEADISDLPFSVDAIAVPSNEFLENPGFGALLSVYRNAGPELEHHIRSRLSSAVSGPIHGPVLEPGDVVTTPAGRLRAKFLLHAVGVSWFGVSSPHLRALKVREQARMLECLFDAAIELGATSIAVPGISTGARRFPSELVALLTVGIARRKIIESNLKLTVYFVSYGPVSMRSQFMLARERALSPLVP